MVDFRQFEDEIREKLDVIAEYSQARLKQSVSEMYPPASSPGNPPHQRTGQLHEGISVQREELGIEIYSEAPYSSDLEEGTSKMAPRPFMRPEQNRVKKEITEMFNNLKVDL